MVYELERVLQVYDGFFCSMSVTYDINIDINLMLSVKYHRVVFWDQCYLQYM